MATLFNLNNQDSITLEDFFSAIKKIEGNFEHPSSLENYATLLKRLSNNETFLIEFINDFLMQKTLNFNSQYTSQVIILGQTPRFLLRANIWFPYQSDEEADKESKQLCCYHKPHDHDFSFLTVGYKGPGYTTETYEYDRNTIVGSINERVKIKPLEKFTLTKGKVVFYRASKDIHTQYYPEKLSISLNLIPSKADPFGSQYLFDINRSLIDSFSPNTLSNMLFSVSLASYLGNNKTKEILTECAQKHENPRLRLASLQALRKMPGVEAGTALKMAKQDSSPYVQNVFNEEIISNLSGSNA